MRSTLRFLTQILILFGPALYVAGACLLLAAFVYVAGWTMLRLASWGVPGVLAFLLSIVVIPAVVSMFAMLVGVWVDDRFSVLSRVKDWIYECTATAEAQENQSKRKKAIARACNQ
jgi:hypothetical protein